MSQSDPTEPPAAQEIPGRWVVLALLMMGALATVGLYVYWDLQTRPFRPLTEAIGREFEHSVPRVEGGHLKRGPTMLRIVLRVNFDPIADEERFQRTVDRLIELARRHQDLWKYETLEIHLIQLRPEETARKRTFSAPTSDLLRNEAAGTGPPRMPCDSLVNAHRAVVATVTAQTRTL